MNADVRSDNRVPTPIGTAPFRQHDWQQQLRSPTDLAAWILIKGNRDFKHRFFSEFPPSKRNVLQAALHDAYLGWPLVFFAIKASRVKIVRYCLENGTDPNVKSPTGIPLLPMALLCFENHVKLEMVRVILEGKADPSLIPLDADDPIPSWIRSQDSPTILQKLRAEITPDIRMELEKARMDHFKSSQPRPILVCKTSIPPGLRKKAARVIALASDKTTTKFDINIIIEKMGASRDERTRHTISGDTLCDQPELQAGYYHVGGYGDKLLIDDFIRRCRGRTGVLVVNDLTKDLDDQDDAIAELARIWRSGEYKSKINGFVYDLANITLLLTIRTGCAMTSPLAIQDLMRDYSEVDSLVPLVHAYGLWPEQVSSQDIGEVINSLAGNQLSSKARLVSSDESMGMRAVPPHGTRASDLDDSIFGGFGRL